MPLEEEIQCKFKQMIPFYYSKINSTEKSIYIDMHKHYVVPLKKKQARVSNDKQKNCYEIKFNPHCEFLMHRPFDQ
jgi:uncharacterized membrane protein